MTSDSEPEIVKKEIKTEPVVDIIDSEDESSKIREKLFSTTSVKEKCEFCNKNFKNLLTLRYHQLHCDVTTKSTSNANKNPVEKSILQIKKTSESPADKILKKLSEKVLKTEDKQGQSLSSKPKVKECGVKVKKISKGDMKKFEGDIEKKELPTASTKLKEKVKKQTFIKPVKTDTKKKPGKIKSSSKSSVGPGSRVRCHQCGKTFATGPALEYHKITFHVAEEESKLFSASLYNEQMNFDKTVLKMNEQEANTVLMDTGKSPKSVARNPSLDVEKKQEKKAPEPSKQEKKKNLTPKVNIKKVEAKKVLVKKKESQKVKPPPKVKSVSEPVSVKSSSGYCICTKPERDDMLG